MKTKREFYRELKEKHGLTTSLMFHENLEEEISDEKYERNMKIWSSLNDDSDDAFDEDDNL